MAEETKSDEAKKQKDKTSRVIYSNDEQVTFIAGKAWGLFIDPDPYLIDGKECYDVRPICLGDKDRVLKILETGELDSDLSGDQREALEYVINYRKEKGFNGQPNITTGREGVERGRTTKTSGYRPKSVRCAKKGKRLPIH